jgi:endogenous inhibitor of DNA gyrase (YacG/DUF329 family)
MIKGRCPICAQAYTIGALADLPSFPFCTERCRLIDLGRWVDGAYVIPGPEPPRQNGPGPEDEDPGAVDEF